MTNGQLIFACGAVLLGLTVLTAIVFALKKPKYTPENFVSEGPGAANPQPFRNGYPTERETIRRDPPAFPSGAAEAGGPERKTAAVFQGDAAGNNPAVQLEETEILPPTECMEQK